MISKQKPVVEFIKFTTPTDSLKSSTDAMSLMFHQDNELLELRETIDAMKVRNEEAQAVIHGALNNQENTKGSDL